MNAEFLGEQFLQNCKDGSVEGCRKMITSDGVDVNF